MRCLYVDLGNSRIKWLLEDARGVTPMQAQAYSDGKLKEILNSAWRSLERPDRLWLASVAGAKNEQGLRQWLREVWALEPRSMEVTSRHGRLVCGYRKPRQLGVDRWAALISAYQLHPQGVCVVDCGTAVTLDVVARQGRHLGGYILPGLSAMRHTLLQGTAMEVNGRDFDNRQEWGDDTIACIELGTRKAVVALIEQAVERLQAAGVCDPAIVLTGGEVGLIEPLLQMAYERRDELVLEGLVLYAREQEA